MTRRLHITATPARVSALMCLVVFLEAVYFTSFTPLLPVIDAELDLGAARVGQVSGAYMLGVLVGIVPAGAVAKSLDPRSTAILGVLALALGGLILGLADDYALIVAARALQGFGCASGWAGAMAAIITSVPFKRRGVAVGNLLAGNFLGAFLGPLVGGLAVATGRPTVLSTLAVVSAAVVIALALLEPAATSEAQAELPGMVTGQAGWRRFTRIGAAGAAIVLSVSIAGGARVVLPTITLAAGGVENSVIAIVHSTAGLAMAASAIFVGRLVDKRGADGLAAIGAAATASCALTFAATSDVQLIMVLVVVLGSVVQVVMTAGFSVLTRENEKAGLDAAVSWTYLNLAWTGGFFLGNVGPSWIASISTMSAAWIAVAVAVITAEAAMLLTYATSATPYWLTKSRSAAD